MADLAFAPQHNMIAYLEKTESNPEFHQIVDFLTSSSIHHSLTSIDPPLSTCYTVGSGEDRMEHDIELTDHVPQTRHDSPLSGGYTPRSDEGSMTLKELMDFCTTLLQKVLDLENVKTAHTKEIANLKKRVTKMKQIQSSRFLGFHPFRAEMIIKDKGNGEKGGSIAETVNTARPDISAARQEVSTAEPKPPPTTTTLFDDKDFTIVDTLVKMKNQKAKEKEYLSKMLMTLLKKRVTKLEQRQSSRISGFHPFRAGTSKRYSLGRRKVSKQERKNLKSQQKFQYIDDLVDEGMNFVLDKDAAKEVIAKDKGGGEKGGSTSEIVSTARPYISAVRPEVSTTEPKTPPITTTLFDDEDVTIADTLVKMKNHNAKEKGVAFKDADDSAKPIRCITTLQPLPTIDPKDKEQIDADHKLAARLTYKEQEKYTVEERSKLLADIFERKKKQLAKEKAEAIRSKPPTKTQLRNLMMPYLKHTGRFTHAQLKSRSFEEIQKLYTKEHKWVDAFVPIGFEEDEKRVGSRKKRATGSSLKHKSPKKQKVNDQEYENSDKELIKCLKEVPDDDKVINYETLDVKSLIVDCESQVLIPMEAVLDRQDVLDLHKIIMERFPANDPGGYYLILWEDLKTLMESSEDDEI
nr:hypothetical protein [Tanacetum cinerariifolium]